MFNIQNYLGKFLKLGLEHQEYKKTLIETINSNISISLPENVVSYKNSVFTLSCSLVIKNAIFIKKSVILESLKNKGIKVIDIK
jgi:hypothetical protein